MRTESLTRLIESDDPVPAVWDTLWDIWYPAGDDVTEHYGRETDAVSYERLLLDVYQEFFTDVLPDKCVNEASLDIPEDGTFVVMDAMSVREASMFVDMLEDEGHEPETGFSFSSVPSETKFYRDRVDYSQIKKDHKTADVKSQEPSLDGDEEIIWCRYPDALLENIQEGKTKLSSIEEMYEKTETALQAILDQLDTDRVVIGSDHGYARLDSGHTFQISDSEKSALQETFSGRFESVGDVDARHLVNAGLVVEADGYYMPIGRYTWPARGKYSTFQHGGLSLAECLTPRIKLDIEK
ncbi:alkaline phosphatase [Halorubrum sp. Boch-26]|uniref:alkaline phosphatase n=1 Tax=Halorubrum sp. Boch-26 TaxID=2994426 RepID=UPI0024698E00|nr:alkaline phosphatase [Halorubrum sp. Boch-26]